MPQWLVLEYLRNRPEEYASMVRKRGKMEDLVWKAYQLDKEYREILKRTEEIRHKMNLAARKVESRGKGKIQLRELKKMKKTMESKLKYITKKREKVLYTLPNIILDGVPIGESEADNVAIKYEGRPKVFSGYVKMFEEEIGIPYEEITWKPKGHAELLEGVLKKGNTYQAAKVAGSRFYYLFSDLVWLDFALSLYAMDFMSSKDFLLVLPPYMVREKVLRSAIDFDIFKEMVYKIEGEDLYLIGTAEHPLLALYIGRTLEEDELPIKLVGWSPCFRKEAGAHGRDTKGIFRVHQFHKVEQFVFSPPDIKESMKYFEELVYNAEELWKNLGIPYRTVNVCSGELGDHAAIKYDIEAWFPAQGRYREVASISNCLDWQAWRGHVVFREKKTGREKLVYTLNGTAIPTSRAICAILENYQKEEGYIEIPKVLRKYLEPFKKAPKDYIYPQASRS